MSLLHSIFLEIIDDRQARSDEDESRRWYGMGFRLSRSVRKVVRYKMTERNPQVVVMIINKIRLEIMKILVFW